jgi:bacillithiol biosynthesis deacetylase BshB1
MSTTADTPQRIDVLAVGPHPDDLEITCGGTIARLVRQGYHVGIIDLTSGEPTPRGTLEIRAAEAEAARAVLGVPVRINLDLPNRVLMDCPENRFILATAFRRLRPRIIIGTAGRTPAASPDHHQAHLLIEAARFYSQLTKWDDRFADTAPYRVPHLVYAPFPFDAEVRHWHSTFVIDVSETYEQKLQAVQCYHSQFDEQRFERVKHSLTGYMISWGSRCGFAYGELFALPGPIGAADLVSLVSGAKAPSAAPVPLPGQPPPPLEGKLVE